MQMKIYHNPRCRKSRESLNLLNEREIKPEIVEYLKDNPSFDELRSIVAKLGIKSFELIRKGEQVFKENYKGKDLTDDEWIQAMVDNPILIERPIVVKGDRAVIGRPPEKVLTLINS